jgi:1-acyl-sn-glycerol-3-phosphate acyltransferase
LDQGFNYLRENISILIFPQTTRSLDFNPSNFNTLGIKLAKRSQLPIVPIALKTDAWGIGRLVKDIGKIDPAKPVRMAFGDPIYITGNGRHEHQRIIQFIENKLNGWSK